MRMATHSCCQDKVCFKMERGLQRNNVLPKLVDNVNEYKNLLPVISAMRNKALKPRHWDKFEHLIGQPIVRDEQFTCDPQLPTHFGEVGWGLGVQGRSRRV